MRIDAGNRIVSEQRNPDGAVAGDRPMTSELAQEVLRNVFPDGEATIITIERIQQTVSQRFDISVQDLTGHGRSQPISYPRQVAMYLCRELTDSSLPKIGREFGGRDHTTGALRDVEDRPADP